MQRRLLIKNILLFTSAVVLTPSFVWGAEKVLPAGGTSIAFDAQGTLAAVVDTLIPKTDTPGAKDLNVHAFVWRMIKDCYPQNAQDRFLKGLTQLDGISQVRFQKVFMQCSKPERELLLKEISDKKTYTGEVLFFFPLMKSLTIQGYMNSEFVMTNLQKYELIPARYNGYFPVKSVKNG
jgi:hypothetical protein